MAHLVTISNFLFSTNLIIYDKNVFIPVSDVFKWLGINCKKNTILNKLNVHKFNRLKVKKLNIKTSKKYLPYSTVIYLINSVNLYQGFKITILEFLNENINLLSQKYNLNDDIRKTNFIFVKENWKIFNLNETHIKLIKQPPDVESSQEVIFFLFFFSIYL